MNHLMAIVKNFWAWTPRTFPSQNIELWTGREFRDHNRVYFRQVMLLAYSKYKINIINKKPITDTMKTNKLSNTYMCYSMLCVIESKRIQTVSKLMT